MNGASGWQRVSGSEIAAFNLNRPTPANLQQFDSLGSRTLEQIKANSLEMMALERLQTAPLCQLSSRQFKIQEVRANDPIQFTYHQRLHAEQEKQEH
jgi:hypothetical protein